MRRKIKIPNKINLNCIGTCSVFKTDNAIKSRKNLSDCIPNGKIKIIIKSIIHRFRVSLSEKAQNNYAVSRGITAGKIHNTRVISGKERLQL